MLRDLLRTRHRKAKDAVNYSSTSNSSQTSQMHFIDFEEKASMISKRRLLQLTRRNVALAVLVAVALHWTMSTGISPLVSMSTTYRSNGTDHVTRWFPELCVGRNRGSTSKCRLEPCNVMNQQTGKLATSEIHYGTGKVIRRYMNSLGQNEIVRPLHMGRAVWQSGCLLSRKYKFVWVHVLKSGGSNMVVMLPRALCGQDTCDDKNVLDYVDCEYAFTNFPQFLTFSFIRNPYSRYYSGISMANLPQYLLLDHPLDIESFANASEATKKNMTSVPLPHFFPQSIHLFDRNDCPVFDVLGRLEHAEEDYQYIMSLIGSPELWDYYRRNGFTNRFNVGSLTKGDNFSLPETLQSPIVRATIRKDYEVDFAHFGMDPFTIPPR